MPLYSLGYVYISLIWSYFIEYNKYDENTSKIVHDNDTMSITKNKNVSILMYYESMFYISYLCMHAIITSLYTLVEHKSDAVCLAYIKLYNNLRVRIFDMTLYEYNHSYALIWLFTAPLILKIFSSYTNIDMKQNIRLEYALHLLHLLYFISCAFI